MRFLHTADWQIGKPFARIPDQRKRALVQQARLDVVGRIAQVVPEYGAELVLVAGDLFDSPGVDASTVSAACAAIGRIPAPVLVIPGNHDHGGPGSVWEQDFFLREREQLAPNLVVLTEPGPYLFDSVVILACPLRSRAGWADPTEWVRSEGTWPVARTVGNSEGTAGLVDLERPLDDQAVARAARIVLAHGSVRTFVGASYDEEESGAGLGAGIIDLDRLPSHVADYVALGDWHGMKQVGPKAWYAGAPEPDRFAKEGDYHPGKVLIVDVARGEAPRVTPVSTGVLRWADIDVHIDGAVGVRRLKSLVEDALGDYLDKALLRLTVDGTLGIEAARELEALLQSLDARLLRLKLVDGTRVEPVEAELTSLLSPEAHPLVSRVADRLLREATGEGEEAEVARIALRELYAAVESGNRAAVPPVNAGGHGSVGIDVRGDAP